MKSTGFVISFYFILACCTLAENGATKITAELSVSKSGVVVAADGTGRYTTVQAAIVAAPEMSPTPYVIVIKPGIYSGQFMIARHKTNIKLVGENPATTVLTYNLNAYDTASKTNYQFNPGLVVVGSGFQAENVTIQNTSGDHGQALAVRIDGDRARFRNCRITGWQDTMMVNNGRAYFTNCYIAGRVDFIYGSGTVVFDHCEVHSRNGGYITAANTPEDQDFGFVFLSCKLTGDSIAWVNPTNLAPTQPVNKATAVSGRPWDDQRTRDGFSTNKAMACLGRPWRPYASVAFVNCWMDEHITPPGWDNWGKESNESTARYSEYNSAGPGANPSARAKWAKLLTEQQAKSYTVKNIFGGLDNWDPTN